jgi:hypothetical protein
MGPSDPLRDESMNPKRLWSKLAGPLSFVYRVTYPKAGNER